MLTAIFSVNILARHIERKLYRSNWLYDKRFSVFAPATLLALREYNNNPKAFAINSDPFIFLTELAHSVNNNVRNYCKDKIHMPKTDFMIHGNTPIGIELEFSNLGKTAGKLFKSYKNDPMHNFSKYHYYNMKKFMWRFGAYIDGEMPFKQLFRKGGFLEYTFTKPDEVFKPSEPLTKSPKLASQLINEAVKFTPVRPHSLHVTMQINKESAKLPKLTFKELLFLMICTGHFTSKDNRIKESRLTENNMKEWAVIRDRRNVDGWVKTVEFTHMRLSRSFIRENRYEPLILLLLAYKNLFCFSGVDYYSDKLRKWAEAPYAPKLETDKIFERLRDGLNNETALPEWYKDEALWQILSVYKKNMKILTGS